MSPPLEWNSEQNKARDVPLREMMTAVEFARAPVLARASPALGHGSQLSKRVCLPAIIDFHAGSGGRSEHQRSQLRIFRAAAAASIGTALFALASTCLTGAVESSLRFVPNQVLGAPLSVVDGSIIVQRGNPRIIVLCYLVRNVSQKPIVSESYAVKLFDEHHHQVFISRDEARRVIQAGSEARFQPNAADPTSKKASSGCYAIMGVPITTLRLATFSVEAVGFADGSVWLTKSRR